MHNHKKKPSPQQAPWDYWTERKYHCDCCRSNSNLTTDVDVIFPDGVIWRRLCNFCKHLSYERKLNFHKKHLHNIVRRGSLLANAAKLKLELLK